MKRYSECPHCQSKEGLYVKTTFYGNANYYYDFDGNGSDHNIGYYDNAKIKEGKYMYCIECDKRVMSLVELRGF